jgi:hypothetical protein
MERDVTKVKAFANIIQTLPETQYETLKRLLVHLHLIQQHNNVNLMTSRNLAVVFGPNLLRSQAVLSSDSMYGDELADMGFKNAITEFLIAETPAIFDMADESRLQQESKLEPERRSRSKSLLQLVGSTSKSSLKQILSSRKTSLKGAQTENDGQFVQKYLEEKEQANVRAREQPV